MKTTEIKIVITNVINCDHKNSNITANFGEEKKKWE